MRISEIIPYLNIEKIKAGVLRDLLRATRRWSQPKRTSASLQAQYGDELHDLEIQQAYLTLEKTRAEIAKTRAETVVGQTKARND
jgi:hypothetical protein